MNKCNINASFSPIDNKVRIGITIKDDHGRYMISRIEWVESILDVEIGEATELLCALK
jgi:hypothetical protein